MAIWLCRAGRHGEYENKFLEDNRMYCTWENLTVSLKSFADRSGLHNHFMILREAKPKTATNWVGQVWPFAHEMKDGDWVMLPSKVKPVIHIGKITGEYVFDKDAIDPFQHYRDVDWFKKDVPRSSFDQDILYSLGAFMTICRIKQEERIKSIVTGIKTEISKKPASVETQEVTEDVVQRDIELDAFDDIKDLLIRKYKGHGMAKVIASILRAKGFVTYVSPEGPDKGVDILAAQGSLGFDCPKLCVQVKSTDNPVDRPTLDQLIGSMSNFKAEYGLLVSWSGFKSSVINEMANQFFKVRFWTHKEIVDEFLANYEKLDDDIKLEIPLKRIWVVNNTEE